MKIMILSPNHEQQFYVFRQVWRNINYVGDEKQFIFKK